MVCGTRRGCAVETGARRGKDETKRRHTVRCSTRTAALHPTAASCAGAGTIATGVAVLVSGSGRSNTASAARMTRTCRCCWRSRRTAPRSTTSRTSRTSSMARSIRLRAVRFLCLIANAGDRRRLRVGLRVGRKLNRSLQPFDGVQRGEVACGRMRTTCDAWRDGVACAGPALQARLCAVPRRAVALRRVLDLGVRLARA